MALKFPHNATIVHETTSPDTRSSKHAYTQGNKISVPSVFTVYCSDSQKRKGKLKIMVKNYSQLKATASASHNRYVTLIFLLTDYVLYNERTL